MPVRVALLIGLAGAGVLLHLTAEDLLLSLAEEDGVLEVLQAGAYLLAGVLAVVGLARRTASRWAWPAAVASLLMCGEEISWGQRLLGFESPAAVAARNRQREFNMHNLAGVNESIRDVGVVLVLLAFLALPLVVRRSARAARLARRWDVVVPGVVCATSGVLAIAYMRIPRWLGRNDFGYDECGELFLALTVLGYVWRLARLRLPRLAAAAEPAYG